MDQKNRRRTLGALSNNSSNMRASLIPAPSVAPSKPAAKPAPAQQQQQQQQQAARRKTLAPGFVSGSQPVAAPKAAAAPAPRQSLAPRASLAPPPSAPMTGGRMSLSATEKKTRLSQGRKSLGVEPRRSSVYGIQNQGQAKVVQDPRQIGEKKTTEKHKRILITYLTRKQYDKPLSPKFLSAPTKQEFKSIITFLFKQVDPSFEFSEKKFEDEVREFMKSFGYPFPISKSALSAVGSPHTWPTLLAALVWLVEFLMYDEQVETKEDNWADGEVNGERMFFEWTSKAYKFYLEGMDDFHEFDAHMQAEFDEKNKSVKDEIEQLQGANQRLKIEIEMLRNSQSDPNELANKRTFILAEIQKLNKLITELIKHKEGAEKKLNERKQEHEQKLELLRQTEEEKLILQQQLDQQEFTPFQVQTMANQKALLEESIDNIQKEKEKIQAQIWEEELLISKRVSEIEKQVSAFNQSGVALQIIPASAKFARSVNYELLFNPHGADHREMTNIDLKLVVKPVLAGLKKEFSDKISRMAKEIREIDQRLKAIRDQKAEIQERVASLQAKTEKIEIAVAKEKENLNQELKGAFTKVEEVEYEIQGLRTGYGPILAQSQQELEKMERLLELEKERILKERQLYTSEICSFIDEATTHKETIWQQLSELEKDMQSVISSIEETPIFPDFS